MHEFDNVEVEAIEGEASRRTYTCQDDSMEPCADEPLADDVNFADRKTALAQKEKARD